MPAPSKNLNRRSFIKGVTAATVGAALPVAAARAAAFQQDNLQVWSCGGLAEAFMPANEQFYQMNGVKVAYTGAFAAALGKSLLGSATTEVFAGRVLALAKKLRAAGKMLYFKPLCFTSYVLVTPKGNPAEVRGLEDLTRPGVRVIQAPQASPPGGGAIKVLFKKAGIAEKVTGNLVQPGSCVQRTMEELIAGRADASVVELRLTRLPQFKNRSEILPIDEKYFPPPPLTFTIGVMKDATDRPLADAFVEFILSPQGQAHFEAAGFIPAMSDKGRELTEKLGVHDV